MDITNRFSAVDFLAYLFPGMVGTLGIYVLLLLTPLKGTLRHLPVNVSTGILFLTISFIFGVISSGFSEMVVKKLGEEFRDNLKTSIEFGVFENEVLKAFQNLLKLGQEQEVRTLWSRQHFYLCRSLVIEKMPSCAQLVIRQSGLRQLRMNIMFPVLIWFVAGLTWGINQSYSGSRFWGVALILASLLSVPPTLISVMNRMDSNEQREVREVLSAFLIGYKAGLFDSPNKDVKPSNIS